MTTETLLLIVLIVLIVGALPSWPYSRSWGYTPTGILGLILIVLVIWAVAGNHREPESVGSAIEREGKQAGEGLKELGRDVKRSVQDAAD